MRLIGGWKRSKLIGVATLFALPILLAACGVSDEELEVVQGDLQVEQAQVQELQGKVRSLETQVQAEQSGVQELEAQVRSLETQVQTLHAQAADLQQREARRFAIRDVFDAFRDLGNEPPSPEAILGLNSLVQASGNLELQDKFVEIVDSALAEAFPLPQEALSQAAAAIQASGNLQVAEKFQEFLAGAERGEGGAPFLEFAALIQASGDPALQVLLAAFVEATQEEGEPSEESQELFGEFLALAEATGNVEIQQAFLGVGGLTPEFFQDAGAKVKAVGDSDLQALFEALSQSPGDEEFEAFFDGLRAAERGTLKPGASSGQ